MKPPSEAALRRLAWVVPALYLFFVCSRILLLVAVPPRDVDTAAAAGELVLYLIIFSLPATALVILRRQPRNRIGWLLMGTGLVWGLGGLTDSYARYALQVQPGSLPGAEYAAVLNAATWVPGLGLMGTFLILLFPDGRLPSRRWRPVAWLSATTIVALVMVIELNPGRLQVGPAPGLRNPLGQEAARQLLGVLAAVLLPMLPVCMLACAVALVLRFRRSVGVERLQIKWLATAGAVMSVLFVTAMTAPALWRALTGSEGNPPWSGLVDGVSLVSFMLLPIAIGTAVLRHRLYDIDLVINRAVVYGTLTVTLAGTYIGSVLLLQLVLNPLTQDSELAVAASTLAVAALFRPARTRIQDVVDRRFYRRRYDAARTLDDFAVRLRQQLDLDAVGADLCAAAEETVQPAHVSLWLRP